ncbi:MAG: hypothetical protein RL227_1147 [Pseudomonadota bacterium]|jgi:acetyltransferase-like isoleucine patch superfamily enzyme
MNESSDKTPPAASAAGRRTAGKPSPDADAESRQRWASLGVELGAGVQVFHPALVNLYGCRIGEGSRIGTFVEIQRGATVGARCKVSSHSFICEGVRIDDEVFIGHGVMFTNDKRPRATAGDGRLQTEADWQLLPIHVKQGASIGSHATVLGGVTIGAHALVGAGAVVTRDVPDHAVVAGVPARVVGRTPAPLPLSMLDDPPRTMRPPKLRLAQPAASQARPRGASRSQATKPGNGT